MQWLAQPPASNGSGVRPTRQKLTNGLEDADLGGCGAVADVVDGAPLRRGGGAAGAAVHGLPGGVELGVHLVAVLLGEYLRVLQAMPSSSTERFASMARGGGEGTGLRVSVPGGRSSRGGLEGKPWRETLPRYPRNQERTKTQIKRRVTSYQPTTDPVFQMSYLNEAHEDSLEPGADHLEDGRHQEGQSHGAEDVRPDDGPELHCVHDLAGILAALVVEEGAASDVHESAEHHHAGGEGVPEKIYKYQNTVGG